MVKLAPMVAELKATIEEFSDALKHLQATKLSDTDFVVKNLEKGTEHKVRVLLIPKESADLPEDVFDAECDCEDFTYRGKKNRKPCKHIYAVLRDFFLDKPRVEFISAKQLVGEVAKMESEKAKAIAEEISQKVQTATTVPTPQIEIMLPQEMQRSEEEEIAKTLDELDEKIIMREWFAGQTPLVYRVMIGDKPRFMLSVRGWVQASLLQKNVMIENIEFFTVQNRLVAIAWAKDTARNVRSFGIAERAPEGEFKLTILANKAMRNALKAVIAPEYERKVIEMAQEMKAIFDLRGF